MAEGDVEIQRPLSERFWEGSIMGIVKVIVEFKADPQHRIRLVVFSLANFEKTLAEVFAQIKSRSNLSRGLFIPRLI